MNNHAMPGCPDCDSEAEIVDLAPNVHLLRIYHDAACPMLARYERSRS